MSDYLGNTMNILAVCTGNICRSPMAEGILRRIFRDNHTIIISSAGTHAIDGNPAAEFALITAAENGIDISGHRARLLNADLVLKSKIILCMEPLHVEWVLSIDHSAFAKVFNLAEFSGQGNPIKSISDPYGASIREYRECFKVIDTCLSDFQTSKGILF